MSKIPPVSPPRLVDYSDAQNRQILAATALLLAQLAQISPTNKG
ncbi:MAG TPA: hypothetical protein VHK67_02615 [Rhabdochlamydiaceae bacterium]|jgi:hypothetical protein|nr:hypothetical protein [Rhabdochlamydiaceae bacterium]